MAGRRPSSESKNASFERACNSIRPQTINSTPIARWGNAHVQHSRPLSRNFDTVNRMARVGVLIAQLVCIEAENSEQPQRKHGNHSSGDDGSHPKPVKNGESFYGLLPACSRRIGSHRAPLQQGRGRRKRTSRALIEAHVSGSLASTLLLRERAALAPSLARWGNSKVKP